MWPESTRGDTWESTALFSRSAFQRTMLAESQFQMFELLNLPRSLKDGFRWAHYAFSTNDTVNPAIEKLAEYPITEWLFTPELDIDPTDKNYQQNLKSREAAVKSWRELFNIQIQAKTFAISRAMDFLLYGNSFVSVYQPFDRILVCGRKGCREQVLIQKADYEWDRARLEFKLKCKKCSHRGFAKVIDRPVRDWRRINLIHFYPGNIDIDFDPYSGERQYYYHIPQEEADKLREGNKLKLQFTPWEIIQAVKIGGRGRSASPKIRLHKHNVFHLVRQGPSRPGTESPWGASTVTPVLRSLLYLNMMRRAQTSLLMDHVIPFRWIFPAHDTGPQSTIGAVDLGSWSRRMKGEIEKWKRDPLYIMIAPVAVGQGQMGGDGKALMLFPEMDQVRLDITSGLNVPQEFIRGGLQYTGSSVSLRMLENSLLNMVEQVEKCFNWVAGRISQITGLAAMNVSLKRFKMADDVQMRQLAVTMWQLRAISGQALGQIMDFDYLSEMRQRNAEDVDAAVATARAQAEAAAKLMSLQFLLQNILPPEAQATVNQADPMAVDQVYQGIRQMKPMDQAFAIGQIVQQNPEMARMLQQKAMSDTGNWASQFQALAAMNPQQQQDYMAQLKANSPIMAMLMANLARQFGLDNLIGGQDPTGAKAQAQPGQPAMLPSVQAQLMPQGPALPPGMGGPPATPGVEPPMPEQKPPRRQGGSPM